MGENMMKKRAYSFLLLLLAMVFLLSVPAFAAEEAEAEAEPVTVTAQVPVEIVLEGPLPETAETFTVELKAVTEGAPMPAGAAEGVYTATVTGAGSLTLEMSFTQPGVYSYKLRQQPGSNAYCEYDEAVYDLTVFATVNEKWELGITTVLEDGSGEKTDKAVFTNVYKPLEPAKYDPPVQKKVEVKRGTAPKDSVFTFAMIPAEKDAPMPENKEARIDEATGALYMDQKGPGSYEFGWMTFTQEHVGKTYVYTVKEVAGSDSRYDYDEEIYTLTIKVSNKDGKVVLDVSYADKSGTSVDGAVFTNVFDDPPRPPSKGPKTGDANNIWIWIALMAASVVIIAVGATVWAKKHKKK